ncbi:hypothetical protein BDN67DRAFT_1017058 [Paxillus ammoniavirescens]|nr:hypothetical protein BDN67DRAFT_1017058 [Paxillus ammoniavirescens]
MLALVSASLSLSETSGEHGDSFRGGKHDVANATSPGQRPSALNSSTSHYPIPLTNLVTSLLMETTLASLKAGKPADTVTKRSTPSSNTSIRSSPPLHPASAAFFPSLPPASAIRQTHRPEAPTAHQTVNSHLYPSLSIFASLSSTFPTPLPPPKSKPSETDSTQLPLPNSLTALDVSKNLLSTSQQISENSTKSCRIHSPTSSQPKSKFNFPITISQILDSKPRPYKPDLTPLPSILRPHCLARQRLLMWLPARAPVSIQPQ